MALQEDRSKQVNPFHVNGHKGMTTDELEQ